MHPGDPDVLQAITGIMLTNAPNPHSGRKLAGQLTAVGFVIDDLGSQALLQPPEAAQGPLLQAMIATAVAHGVITEQQSKQLRADIADAVRRGDFHMSVTILAVLAHKPGRLEISVERIENRIGWR